MEVAAPGLIESTNYPYLQVHFLVRGREETVWAYVDTGFDGHLAVPQGQADGFGAPDGAFDLEMANGEMVASRV